MIRILLLLAMILPAEASELKVLSWNTFMLPWPIRDSNQEIRTGVIAETLQKRDYDFVFMQEAFMSSFREKIGNTLKAKYPHQFYLDNAGILYPFFGSGVFVLARHPFYVLDKIHYSQCGDSDCWASKGVVLIESKLPSGKSFQFAVTHMQAHDELASIRLHQLHEIKDLLKKNKKSGIPQLLVGDLNIDSSTPEFQQGLDLMKMAPTQLSGPFTHTNVIDCYKKPGFRKKWIDHIWVERDLKLKESSISVLPVDYKHNGKTCMASDHHAIEGIFNVEGI